MTNRKKATYNGTGLEAIRVAQASGIDLTQEEERGLAAKAGHKASLTIYGDGSHDVLWVLPAARKFFS